MLQCCLHENYVSIFSLLYADNIIFLTLCSTHTNTPRASAYDVFAPGILAQASQAALGTGGGGPPPGALTQRRGSFRIIAGDMDPMLQFAAQHQQSVAAAAAAAAGADDANNSPSPDHVNSPVLLLSSDDPSASRMRRRGSQL